MLFIVPEEKAASKKFRFFAGLIAFIAMIGIIALFIWGIVLIERGKFVGILPIVIAVILSLLQIF